MPTLNPKKGSRDNKEQLKQAKYKTLEERISIVNDIKSRISTQLLIDIDTYESQGMQEFAKILKEYSSGNTLMSGFSGKIFIQEIDRYLEYTLPISKHALPLVKIVGKE